MPTPLLGCEKFVTKFPLAVLRSFIRSFPVVQRLAVTKPTKLLEDFLLEWWPAELGPHPCTTEAIALMRLVIQAHSYCGATHYTTDYGAAYYAKPYWHS